MLLAQELKLTRVDAVMIRVRLGSSLVRASRRDGKGRHESMWRSRQPRKGVTPRFSRAGGGRVGAYSFHFHVFFLLNCQSFAFLLNRRLIFSNRTDAFQNLFGNDDLAVLSIEEITVLLKRSGDASGTSIFCRDETHPARSNETFGTELLQEFAVCLFKLALLTIKGLSALVIHHYHRYTHRFFEAQSRLLFRFLSLASDLFLGRLGSTTIASR